MPVVSIPHTISANMWAHIAIRPFVATVLAWREATARGFRKAEVNPGSYYQSVGACVKTLGGLLGSLLLTANVLAADGLSLEAGNGDYTDTARVGVIWNWQKQWFKEGGWLVTGFWEATAGRWRGKSPGGDNQTITDLGITPVFRLQQRNRSGLAPYLEGAIGFHLISPTYDYADRKFGSAFQFGDHVGFGACFGELEQYDVGYRFQHLSNGGIKEPNQGINVSELHFAYYF